MNILTKFPIGQYVDGNKSWLRIIDSRIKLLIVLIFLLSPIWSGPIWRLSLVGCLFFVTFISFLPTRVWWRSFLLLILLSLLIGLLSIFASSTKPLLDNMIRDPSELGIVIDNQSNWNILEIPAKSFGLISFGPFYLSRKALELGIKTSTLIFTVIHSVNLMLLTTLQEDLIWAFGWFLSPLRSLRFPIEKWLFQLLLALRFIPLVQEELQNISKSISVRSINLKNLGFKNSFHLILDIIERLFQNILLRIDQGAESLLAKNNLFIKTNRFKTIQKNTLLGIFVNSLAIFFICLAILLRKLYGAL